MSDFEFGDDALIEQLLHSGEPVESIADKWDVTPAKIRAFCKRKGISIINKSPEKNGCHRMRLATERGEHKSETVQTIIRMQSSHSVDAIAAAVKRSSDFVRRMIDVHISKDKTARHKLRYNIVTTCAERNDISLSQACIMTGITHNQFCYSARAIGVQGPKKSR
jgi:D-serine dehydratase